MPVWSHEKAFALRDNPFRPMRRIPGVTRVAFLASLETRPLRMDIEPALRHLYVPKLGLSDRHEAEFQHVIRSQGGYRPGSAGFQSFIFLISGYQGTGKTTLASAMIQWV